VNGAGTKQAFENALDALKPKLNAEDLLLIHTNNHGGHNGTQSYLCTYSGVDYMASDFANKLNELPAIADLMVMMEQCHSGGFNDLIIEKSTAERITFSGACTEGKNSIGGADFDPFARDWIAALAGSDPYGSTLLSDPDYDNSGKISAREAFAYADDIHNAYDSPVYSAFGKDAGDQHLHQKWFYIVIYREFVVKELLDFYHKLDDPIQYREAMKTDIIPDLTELDNKMRIKPLTQEEAHKAISQIIRAAGKKRGVHDSKMEEASH
jgi:hypothetical protein